MTMFEKLEGYLTRDRVRQRDKNGKVYETSTFPYLPKNTIVLPDEYTTPEQFKMFEDEYLNENGKLRDNGNRQDYGIR